MAKWEYAYIQWRTDAGVITWRPTSSNGRSGHTEEILDKKEDVGKIVLQQVAKLCEEGWEIFAVNTTGTNRSDSPMTNVYHFRRSS